jgi:hypothetical protein
VTEDDFLAWRDHPVTKWIFKAVEAGAEEQKAEWIRASWEGATANPLLLVELRTRADSYRALIETSFMRWSEMNEPTEP